MDDMDSSVTTTSTSTDSSGTASSARVGGVTDQGTSIPGLPETGGGYGASSTISAYTTNR
jgi:hypothetical protein